MSLEDPQNSVKEVLQQIPKDAVRWGAAGLIPYAGTSAAIAYFARQVYIATELGGAVGSQRFLPFFFRADFSVFAPE